MAFWWLILATGVLGSDRDPSYPLGGNGKVISVESSTNWCIFLPPNHNETIADSEGYPNAPAEVDATFGRAFCTQPNANAPGAKLLYDGAITGAHFEKTDWYVQVTGSIDAAAAGLVTTDGGGYYDLDRNVNSPPGGMCAGYDSFYNFVGPIDSIFCVRCCKGIDACQIQNGEKGCQVMVPGIYDKTFDTPLPSTGRVPDNQNSTASHASNGGPSPSNTTSSPSRTSSTSSSANSLDISGFILILTFLHCAFRYF